MSNEISLALSDEVEARVESTLGTVPSVRVTADSTADVLSFRATAATADDAATYANAWANAYIETKQDEAVGTIAAATESLASRLEELRADRQDLQAPLDDLLAQIAVVDDREEQLSLQHSYDALEEGLSYELYLLNEQAEAAVNGLSNLELQAEVASVGQARVVQTAAPPVASSNAPLSRNLALALIIGLMAGFAVALLIDGRDTTIKGPDDIQAVADLPVLASIPLLKRKVDVQPELAGILDPKGMLADGYHKVRSGLEFLSINDEVRTVLITSANPSEGKSTTAANLTAALASVGQRAVLVDVDFRRPRVHSIFGVPQEPGLSDLVVSEVAAESITRHIGDLNATMWAIPTGRIPPNPASFVGTSAFLDTVDWLAEQADVTILDAPPLLAVSEAHSLARHVDAVVITAMAGQTTGGELVAVIEQLQQVGANLAGIVLVGVAEGDAYGRHKQYYTNTPSESLPGQAGPPARRRGAWAPAATVGGSAAAAHRADADADKARPAPTEVWSDEPDVLADPAPGHLDPAPAAGPDDRPIPAQPVGTGNYERGPLPGGGQARPRQPQSSGPSRRNRHHPTGERPVVRPDAARGPVEIDLTDRDRRPPSGRIPDEHDLALAEALEDLRRTTAGRTNGRHHPPADLDQPVWADDA